MTKSVSAAPKKVNQNLTLSDRIDIIKNHRSFPLVFPLGMLVFLILLFGALTGGRFFTANVFKGIFNQSVIVGTMATAVCFIYTTGNIDFSVGNVMGLAATFGAMTYQATNSMAAMVVVTFVCGIALMLVNCSLSVIFNVKGAMVAIVAMSVYGALTVVLVGANPIGVNIGACKELEQVFRPVAFTLYFLLCLVCFHNTSIGRKLRFIGGNEECARQTGINLNKSQFVAFLLAGIGVGLAGVFQILRTGNVAQTTGTGMGMDVMLATVLGGMSIFGGSRSKAYAGFIGACTVTVLNKGLLMVGVSSTLIQGTRGIIFLLLVYLNSERQTTLPSRQQF